MQPAYNLDKIKFATDPPTFEKAVALYESGKVTEFKEGIGAYSAIVAGTKPYRVSVEARRFGLATCTCYLGQNDTLCKHMVAVSIYAVMRGKKIKPEDAKVFSSSVCSGKLGKLSEEELKKIKQEITSALKYIKAYSGPSRTWFAYQASLSEGCNRLAKIVSELPAGEQTAELLVSLLLRLDKKLCTGGVDDSDGTVGGFIEEVVVVLQEYAKLDPECKKALVVLEKTETCFGWEEPLLKLK
ncbi:MAG: SWIM zinc finger family protein [Candidatus Moraniibacteriota bacterium]|nr:SWIM zinc finger family protein [Candidatus Moranbacteria bacterium]HRZ34149.1 SWIM zinc finger family protein [Candidatus Moranbacteria bacterium]